MSCAKTGWTDRDAAWDAESGGPKEPHIRWVQIPMERGNFEGKGMPPTCPRHSDVICLKWLNRPIWVVDSGRPKEAQVQSYSPGGANVPSWKNTLAPPGEYDWTVRLRRRCCLMSNYFDYLLFLATWFGLPICKNIFKISGCNVWRLLTLTSSKQQWYKTHSYSEL